MEFLRYQSQYSNIVVVLYLCSWNTEKSKYLPKVTQKSLFWAVSLQLCLLVMKQWLIFFWRPFSYKDQRPACNYFALWSLRNFKFEEWKILTKVWMGVKFCSLQKLRKFGAPSLLSCLTACGHVTGGGILEWMGMAVSLGCRCFGVAWLKTFFLEYISISACSLSPSACLPPFRFSIPLIFASLGWEAASGRTAFALVLCPSSLTSYFWRVHTVKHSW